MINPSDRISFVIEIFLSTPTLLSFSANADKTTTKQNSFSSWIDNDEWNSKRKIYDNVSEVARHLSDESVLVSKDSSRVAW